MNALVSIDVAALTPETVFAPGGVETILTRIEAEVRAEAYDIATPEGRERIKSVAYKVARSKTALDDMGKELVAEIKKKSGAIDAERRIIRDRLDALKEEVRGPLSAWEQAEDDRIALHESALVFLAESARFATPPSVETIRERIQSVQAAADRDFQEFADRASAACSEAMATLITMLETAEQRERDAAELAELRRLKAEREEADRKAEAERVAAQQAAERQAYEERREKERAEKAERDKAAAVAAAIEAERKRQEAEAARAAQQKAAEEAARQKREANAKHRAKVHSKITLALSEVLTGNADEAAALIEAIAAGKIPHVSITY
jgi:septal ring factor EnvC (AmiA/AmiB activator)